MHAPLRFFTVLLVIGTLWPLAAIAGERYHASKDTVAIKGYDPVAYFTMGEPVRGSPEISYEWQEKTWHFASAEHRDAFTENPRHYAPHYGGFCAGAMTLGWKAPIDPEAFAIINDKLYLAYSKGGIANFEEDADTNIPRADKNWERLSNIN